MGIGRGGGIRAGKAVRRRGGGGGADSPVMLGRKLQAQVYDILPPTTAVVDYVIGVEKLSANEQFFDDAQIAIHL